MKPLALWRVQREIGRFVENDLPSPCIEYLLTNLVEGNKQNHIRLLKSRLTRANNGYQQGTIRQEDYNQERSHLIYALNEFGEGIEINDLISPIKEPLSSAILEVWIYCFEENTQKLIWEEAFERVKMSNDIWFKDFQKYSEVFERSEDSRIIVFDLTGISDHASPNDFLYIPERMRNFLWFMLDVQLNTYYEKVIFGHPASFIYPKLCPYIKLISPHEGYFEDDIKECIVRIAERRTTNHHRQ